MFNVEEMDIRILRIEHVQFLHDAHQFTDAHVNIRALNRTHA